MKGWALVLATSHLLRQQEPEVDAVSSFIFLLLSFFNLYLSWVEAFNIGPNRAHLNFSATICGLAPTG